jgi:hypothetical protein
MRRGQSATELVLMLPVLLGLLFVVVELGVWLAGSHYTTYAAFAGARAQQVGRDPEDATGLLLDGRATRRATTTGDGTSVTVQMPWAFDLPFTPTGDLSYDVTVTAGPDEEKYEGRSGNLSKRYADDNCRGGC